MRTLIDKKKPGLYSIGSVVCLLIGMIFLSSCEDFVEIDPPETGLVGETVFEDDVNASSAMSGIYSRMVESNASVFTGEQSITFFSGLSADEFINYNPSDIFVQFTDNELFDDNSFITGNWISLYQIIYSSNSALEGLANSTGITDSISTRFEGEAKFIRAWNYFILVNLWGDVPLVLSTDYQVNSLLPRTPVTGVYDQIIRDLNDARNLLGAAYPSEGRIRPNQAVANALLSRVYLYTEDWSNAESSATTLLDDPRFSLETDLNNVFSTESEEAIWQLQSVRPAVATFEGLTYILTRPPSSRGVSLQEDLINAFEEDDDRDSLWVGSITSRGNTFYFPFKYKERLLSDGESTSQFLTVFRLAEVYLIRAEARARQGNLTGAAEDLNAVRLRAGLPASTANDQEGLLLAIEQERRIELFSEWGHRWLDLKRTGRASEILGALKSGWQDTDVLWPLPLNEFLNNPNLGAQNDGY